jgi:hypothetical protein
MNADDELEMVRNQIAELRNGKEELRKMLIAIVDSCEGKIEVPYSVYYAARGERVLLIEADNARQTCVLTAK